MAYYSYGTNEDNETLQEQRLLFSKWSTFTPDQRKILLDLMDIIKWWKAAVAPQRGVCGFWSRGFIPTHQPCWDGSIDVKSWEIEVQKSVENKGFPGVGNCRRVIPAPEFFAFSSSSGHKRPRIRVKKAGIADLVAFGVWNRVPYCIPIGFDPDHLPRLCGCIFRISAKSFYQINPVQTELLYGQAIAFAGLTGRETVIDAYCGIGTIGLIASRKSTGWIRRTR